MSRAPQRHTPKAQLAWREERRLQLNEEASWAECACTLERCAARTPGSDTPKWVGRPERLNEDGWHWKCAEVRLARESPAELLPDLSEFARLGGGELRYDGAADPARATENAFLALEALGCTCELTGYDSLRVTGAFHSSLAAVGRSPKT